jgi:hypothetical protein
MISDYHPVSLAVTGRKVTEVMTTITLFHGLAGWTAALMVAFGLGTMTGHLADEVAEWLDRRHV